LRRAEHVARGMERKLDPVARQDLAIGRCLDRDVAKALAKYGRRVGMGRHKPSEPKRAWSEWAWVMMARETGRQGSI